MSYKTLEIWILANELVHEIHEMTERLGKSIRNFYHWVEENHKPSL
jgi:hypothetical protein